MNPFSHTRKRRFAVAFSTLSLVAYSGTMLTPVRADTTPDKQDPSDKTKNEPLSKPKTMPLPPGNPTVIVNPTDGSGNNAKDYNKDGTKKTVIRPRKDQGDLEEATRDPRSLNKAKRLPIFGYSYFANAREIIDAKRNALLRAAQGNMNDNGQNASRSNSRRTTSNRSNTNSKNGDDGTTRNTNKDTTRDGDTTDTRLPRRNGDDTTDDDSNTDRNSDRNSDRSTRRSNRDNTDDTSDDNSDTRRNRRNDNGDDSDTDRNSDRSTRRSNRDSSDDNSDDTSDTRRNRDNTDDTTSQDDEDYARDQRIRRRLAGQSDTDTSTTRRRSNDNTDDGYGNDDTTRRRRSSSRLQDDYNNTNGSDTNNYGNSGRTGTNGNRSPRSINALNEITDPIDLLNRNVVATPPANYQLSGGDEVVIHISSAKNQPIDMTRTIDPYGNLDLGEMGRYVVRGRTIDNLQTYLQQRIRGYYKNADVSISLRQLHSIAVTVQGEAYNPGTFVVPSVTTVSLLLNAVGGPTIDGSLRDIKVIRQGHKVGTFDFYKFITDFTRDSKEKGQEDIPLQPGDIVIIPNNGARVAISGEVRHAAQYEVKPDETLQDALAYAGGVKASGVDQIVQVNTIEPGENRVLRNVNLRDAGAVSKFALYDGDTVEIHSLRPTIENKVTVEGAITQPGDFALAPGMRVADLLRMARNPISEAFLARAALKRWNPDNTTSMISIDLAKAIENDPANNIPLMKWDRLKIYSRQEAAFIGTRKVMVRGAVQREGSYEYSQNMRVSDILLRAGSPLPDAEMVVVQHQRGDGTFKYEFATVADIAHGEKSKDVPLEDNDIVAVYKNGETQFIAEHKVRIDGEVVTPGLYARGEGMKLSELLVLAGGFRPGATPLVKVAHARRPVDAGGTTNLVVSIAFDSHMRCAPQDDLRLEDGDVVAVQGTGGLQDQPSVVRVLGAVNSPGPIFLKSKNVHLSDIIKEAGGFRPEAFPEGAEFNRNPKMLSSKTQQELAVVIASLSNLLNDSAHKRELAKGDIERINALNSANSNSASIIPGLGGASTNNAAASTIADQLSIHSLVTPPRKLTDKELDPSGNIAVNLPEAIHRPGGTDDILLMDGDTVIVPETPTTVQVIGAVTNQRGVLYKPGAPLDFYVSQAGGFTVDSATTRIVVIRAGGGVIPANKVKQLRPGDVILVPTKVLAEKIARNGNGFDSFFKSLTNSAILFKVATGVFGL